MAKGPGPSPASNNDNNGINHVATGGVLAVLMAPGTKGAPDNTIQATMTMTPAQECLKERYWSYFLASRCGN